MNKAIALISLSLLSTPVLSGAGVETKTAPLTRILLSGRQHARHGQNKSVTGELQEYIPAIIRIDETAGDDALPDFVSPLGRRGDLVLVNVPAERISEVMSAPGILRIESGVCALPAMDVARTFCNLAEAQSGASPLPRSFDGSGVVCGFTDIGFDPGHVNFTDQSTGQCRVRLLANYDTYLAGPETAYTAEEINAWITDNSGNWHATHVAGILAGSANTAEVPYMGVAPGADIAATTSTLNGPYLLAGCDRVTEYAKSQGKPAVINMSISSFTGPRDGTTLFNRYLSRIAEDAAVCVSAGNDGDRTSGYFRFTPTASRPAAEARAIGSDWDCVDVSGVADFWSLDSTPFSVSPVIWDDLEKRICLTLPSPKPGDGADYLEFSPENTPELSALDGFNARIIATCELNPDNNRFNAAMGIEYTNNGGVHYEGDYDAAKSRYHVGFRLSSDENATVDCHVSSSLMMMTCGSGTAPDFSNSLTINDLCCGEGVIAVGAMNSRTSVPVIGSDDQRVVSSAIPGSVATFTSFGDTPHGALPHICAPGATVISSVSEPYIEAQEIPDDRYCAVTFAGGRRHHWGEASGTSMSSPYVAGVLALWLQADPSLTPSELRQIACETAAAPRIDPADPRWGAGTIDALAGLLHILGASSIAAVTAETPAAEFAFNGQTLVCTALRSAIASLTVHTPDGRLIASAGSTSSTTSVTLPGTSAPVIIAVATLADGSRHHRRILRPL